MHKKDRLTQFEKELEQLSHDIERMRREAEQLLMWLKRSPRDEIERHVTKESRGSSRCRSLKVLTTDVRSIAPDALKARLVSGPGALGARGRERVPAAAVAPYIHLRHGTYASLDPASKQRLIRNVLVLLQKIHKRPPLVSVDVTIRIRAETGYGADYEEEKVETTKESISRSEWSV
jgi:hypothetical protein